ncbi:MAG: Phage protein [Variovorax sp.]|nr:Phage protein [Variovorax sp.]
MTAATTIAGRKVLIQLGDGAGPEVFAAPCAVTTKTFGITKAMADSIVPDCTDPDLVGWVAREPTSKSSDISGSGIVNEESLELWQAFAMGDDNKSVRIVPGTVGHWQGKYHCTSFRITGAQAGKATFDFSLVSDGEVTWTAT